MSTNEILRVLDLLQANNEPVSLDGIYVCSYYTDKNELQKDLMELVESGVLCWIHDNTYTRALISGPTKERANAMWAAVAHDQSQDNLSWPAM